MALSFFGGLSKGEEASAATAAGGGGGGKETSLGPNRNAPPRSPSTVQLLGSIEHCVTSAGAPATAETLHVAASATFSEGSEPLDSNGSPTNSSSSLCVVPSPRLPPLEVDARQDEEELRRMGYETLLNTSTSLLSVIQVLRRIIRQYAYGRMGRELQHLSLTVASFERILYTFIKEEILIPCQESNHIAETDFRRNNALKDIIPLIPKREHYTILTGGLSSLLRHATKSLDETRQLLEELQSQYDPHRETRWSLGSLAVICAGLMLCKRFTKRTSMWSFVTQLVPSRERVKYAILFVIGVDYWNRFMYRFSRLRRIKIHHARVLMTLRLFLLCQCVLNRARRPGTPPDSRLLIDKPIEADIDDDLKNATILLLEKVPFPSEYYDRSCDPLGFTLFKRGGNVLTASSACVHSLLGGNERLVRMFGPLMMLLAIPYYSVRHHQAVRYTTRVLIDQPSVNVIRMGWAVYGESKLVQWLSEFRSKKLAVRSQMFVCDQGVSSYPTQQNPTDIGIHVFSARPLKSVVNGTWEGASCEFTSDMKELGLPQKKHVLLYIHGGGFFGRFLAFDSRTLCDWATRLGAVIVYVDYSLAPESQHPVPLNQSTTVYKWLHNGGLGFIPDKIAVFGESAGGNLAAALTIKCIQDKIPVPAGNVLMFPALQMHMSPSPSRFLHQNDPVLPRSVMELALNSEFPHHGHDSQYKHNIHDPQMSVGLAEDSLLAKFPPTSLVVGDLDPLLDDSVDFNTRLRQLKVPGSLKLYCGLSHGFLLYGDLVPEAQKAIDETCDRVRKLYLGGDTKETQADAF